MLTKKITKNFSKIKTLEEVIKKIKPGMSIMAGGFGLCGIPGTLINKIASKKEINNLTIISNDGGTPTEGLGKLLNNLQIKKMVSSYIGDNKLYEKCYFNGDLELELIPQGTLAEKIRAGGAGIPIFGTATGVGTLVEKGGMVIKYGKHRKDNVLSLPKKSYFDKNGRKFILEESMRADVAIVKAWKADEKGNLIYNKTARNFNPDMAKAADYVIAEVEEIVEKGEFDINNIHTPSIYVDAIIKTDIRSNPIEKKTNSENMAISSETKKNKKFSNRLKIAKTASKFIKRGNYINLGIGIPTLVPLFIQKNVDITTMSENGLLGMSGYPEPNYEEADLIDAGKCTIKAAKSASTFSSSESFSMIRGGHLDWTLLGTMEVCQNGSIANWIIPLKLVKGMGGAMDLVASKSKVMVLTNHCDKYGNSKILKKCKLPVTGKNCVTKIVTELAVFDVKPEGGLVLTHLAEDTDLDRVKELTDAEFHVREGYERF